MCVGLCICMRVYMQAAPLAGLCPFLSRQYIHIHTYTRQAGGNVHIDILHCEVGLDIYIYMYIHIYMINLLHTYMHTYIHIYIHDEQIAVLSELQGQTCTMPCAMYASLLPQVCMLIYMYVYMCVCIHIYIGNELRRNKPVCT
jgi:hypothetical protein